MRCPMCSSYTSRHSREKDQKDNDGGEKLMFRKLWRKIRCTLIIDCFLEEIHNLEDAVLEYGDLQGEKILHSCMDQMIKEKKEVQCGNQTYYAFDLRIYKQCLEKHLGMESEHQ